MTTSVTPFVSQNGIRLGEVAASTEEINALVDMRERQISGWTARAPNDGTSFAIASVLRAFTYEEYLYAIKRHDSAYRELRLKGEVIVDDSPALRHFISIFNRRLHTPDIQGWRQYLNDVHPHYSNLISQLESKPRLFSEAPREGHTLITGPSRWGKSELMKALVEHDAMRGGVVVIDPDKDMATELAHFPQFHRGQDRLVYLSATLDTERMWCINPMRGEGLSTAERARTAQYLTRAITDAAMDMSKQAQTLCRSGIELILSLPFEKKGHNPSLRDLQDLMWVPDRNSDAEEPPIRKRLLSLARNHPNPNLQKYFRSEFPLSFHNASKNALRARLDEIFSYPSVDFALNTYRRFRLDKALENERIVLFDLSGFGDGAATMARFILALIVSHGFRRSEEEKENRKPVHVYIDEAQSVAGENMIVALERLGKRKIHFTLAQQVEGKNHSAEAKQSIRTSTACKAVGGEFRSEVVHLFNRAISHEESKLSKSEFWVKWGGGTEPVRLRVRSDLANLHKTLNSADWSRFRAKMLDRYYVSVPKEEPLKMPDEAPMRRENAKVEPKQADKPKPKAREKTFRDFPL